MYVCAWQCFQWPFSANCNDKKETYTKDKAAYYHIMTYNNIDKQKEIVFCTCQGVANTTVYCETNLCKMYSITCHIFLRKSYLLVLVVISNIRFRSRWSILRTTLSFPTPDGPETTIISWLFACVLLTFIMFASNASCLL